MLKEMAHFENYVQGSIQDWKRALEKLQMVKSFFDYIWGLHIPSGLFISVVFGSLIYF